MKWRLILACGAGGWLVQTAWFLLTTRRWFVQLVFPGAEGWGLWAAGLGMFRAFLYGVLPITCLGVLVITHRLAPQNKWSHALLAALITLAPVMLFILLHFSRVNFRLAAW